MKITINPPPANLPVVEWVSAVCDNGLADTITRFEA